MAELRVDVAPRISRDGFRIILERAGSPAAPVAAACYDAILAYGLDPAVGLAFFHHESTYGQAGAAATTRNWGNIRARGTWLAHHDGVSADGKWLQYRQRPGEPAAGHWIRSAADWAQLVRELYCTQWGRNTVQSALLKYAPSEDQNDPASYAACVGRDVAAWTLAYPPESAEPAPPPPLDLLARVADLESRVDRLERQYAPGGPWGPATTTDTVVYSGQSDRQVTFTGAATDGGVAEQ